MRFIVALLSGWLVALVVTAVLTLAATGLVTAGMGPHWTMMERPQILVAAAVVLLLGSFAGGAAGGRYLKGSGRTLSGMLVGILLLITTIAVIISTGLRQGQEFIVDPMGYVAVPLAAAVVGSLVGVALAKPPGNLEPAAPEI
jgi:hypothetical protein